VRLRVALAGGGPLIVLPESWYSWRHQIPVPVEAGYRVAAPDVRGYGGSDKPQAIDAYAIKEMCADIAGLVAALGEERAILIGHDWGASTVWNMALFHPERVRALVALSVPYLGRGPMPSVELYRRIYKDRFFYQLYFQEPGVAEAELEADLRTSLRKIYYWTSGEAAKAKIKSDNSTSGGLLSRLVASASLPAWLTEADLDYYVSQLQRSGFRGPLNRYRNSELDFAQQASVVDKRVEQPSAFVAGSLDAVLRTLPGVGPTEKMREQVTDLRFVRLIEDAGHWVQQQRPAEVSAALLEFYADFEGSRHG